MNERGFSLMELMITVVVIGILAAIAIPAYTGHVTRTRRSEAVTALQTVALNEEKFMAEKGGYGSLTELRMTTGLNLSTQWYDIYVNPATDLTRQASYTAVAVPVASFEDKAGSNYVIFAIGSDGTTGKVVSASRITTAPALSGITADKKLWDTLRP